MSTDTGFAEPILPGEKVRARFPAYGVVYLIAWAVMAVVMAGGLYQFLTGTPVSALAGKLAGPLFAMGYGMWRLVPSLQKHSAAVQESLGGIDLIFAHAGGFI